MGGTASDKKVDKEVEFPGWYITFQTAVLQQLPRPGDGKGGTLDQFTTEAWTNNQRAMKAALTTFTQTMPHTTGRPAAPPTVESATEKFSLLADLGVITVPEKYNHETALSSFREGNHRKFYSYNDSINDQNFPNPSRILKPGDKLHVQAFKQTVPGSTTSDERLTFLATQKAVYPGAQGASLVFEQRRDKLPKGYWYSSFDEKERLWQDAVGYRGVPYVHAFSDGDFYFHLGSFEHVWHDFHALLCFREVE